MFITGKNPEKKDASKPQRSKRRKSNWYIYLISFAATAILLVLFVTALQDRIFLNKTKHEATVDADLDVTFLFMMSERQGGVPGKFMLLNFRPLDEKIVLVPLNPNTLLGNSSLTAIYSQGGSEQKGALAVMESIEKNLNIECKFYVHFDRSSFTGFVSTLVPDEVPIKIPYDFTDINGELTLDAGQHRLNGSDLFLYMTYADFPQAGEDSNLTIMGSSAMSLINYNCRNMTSDEIQESFQKIRNNATTNFTYSDYTRYQQTLQYAAERFINPASYLVPKGHYEAGAFVISSQSRLEILDTFALADVS